MHHEEYLSSAARSTLRPIVIRGEGEHIESLTSYIGRLAWHHSVKPSLLIGSLIDPGKSAGFLNYEIATSFNSLTPKTATIVESVAAQAGLASHLVAAMTFVHLHDQIDHSARGFIRKNKQWCPVCYHDDHSNGGQYDRLAWSLQGVSHCVKHRCKLRDYCQHCLKAQPYLSTKCEVGFCHHCEQSLSESVLSKRADVDCKESEVYSSLVLGIVDQANAETESLESILRQIAYMFSAEGIPRFAEFLKMDRHCVERWMTGETKPALKSVQRVCGKLKVPWADVLMKRMSAPSWSNVGAHLSEDIQRRYSMTEIARIRKEAIPDVFSGRYQESVQRAKRGLGFAQ